MKYSLYVLALLALPLAAQPPTPAPVQSRAVVLTGGTLHLGNGQTLENASIRFENGKITDIGPNADRSNAEVIDVAGRHVYPGLISANSTLGLVEVEAVRSTRDFEEVGDLNPNVRSAVAYNTDSEIIPTVRSNGVLMAQVAPQGGWVSGTSSIMQLDAWNWEDAVYRLDDGIHLNWPDLFRQTGWWAEPGPIKVNEKRTETITELERAFAEAKAFGAKAGATPNLRLQAMRGLFDGSKALYIHANYGKEIIEAVKFAKTQGVKRVVIVGGNDAHLVIDFLKENNVAVLLNTLHRLPGRAEDDVDLAFRQPTLLHKAGILVGLTYGAGNDPWGSRNLPFLAGTTAGFGLNKEEALMLVTGNTARILGIGDRTGTLEKGKEATLVVSTGDLLDMRTNNVTHAFINGRRLDLNDKHKRLYNRFKGKYGK